MVVSHLKHPKHFQSANDQSTEDLLLFEQHLSGACSSHTVPDIWWVLSLTAAYITTGGKKTLHKGRQIKYLKKSCLYKNIQRFTLYLSGLFSSWPLDLLTFLSLRSSYKH